MALNLCATWTRYRLWGRPVLPSIIRSEGSRSPASSWTVFRCSARVLAITTREDSSLAAIADVVVAVPVRGSRQFGKSLFEQDSHAYKTMSRRHTNLELQQ